MTVDSLESRSGRQSRPCLPASCPGRDTMLLGVLRGLPDDEFDEFNKHIEACMRCKFVASQLRKAFGKDVRIASRQSRRKPTPRLKRPILRPKKCAHAGHW